MIERGPNPHCAVVTSRGKHEGVGSRVPGHTGQVAANHLCPDVVQQRSRFTIPDVNIAGCVGV